MRVKIRKGDTVEVISGRLEDKGKRGEVITVMTSPRLPLSSRRPLMISTVSPLRIFILIRPSPAGP